jgi:hypothetical protein
MNADLDQRLQRAGTDFDNAVSGMATPHARVAVTSDARGRVPAVRRRVAFAVIGVAATIGVLAAVVATCPESNSVVPADTAQSPHPIDTTPPTESAAPVESAAPIATTTQIATTTPIVITTPTVVGPDLVMVDESALITAALQRTVLYTAGSGSTINDLGQEQCSECDGVSPSNPLIDDDGTIIIGDPQNRRVVVVSDGTPIAVPYPELTLAGQGVLADHLVYLPMRVGDPTVAPPTTEIHVLRVEDLKAGRYTIVDRYEVGTMFGLAPLSIRDGQLLAGDTPIKRLSDVPLGTPQVSRGGTPNDPELIVSFSGRQMTWRFPAGWAIDQTVPMPDGSIAATGYSESRGMFAIQLLPTGQAIVGDIDDNVSDSLTAQITAGGIAQLETAGSPYEVVRYSLPANNVTMHISNQSVADPTVGITVSIDGTDVIDGDFEVGSQHTWAAHELSLAPGQHTVIVTSSTGATKTTTVDTTWEAHQWMVVDYSKDSGTPPELSFESFDEPVPFR